MTPVQPDVQRGGRYPLAEAARRMGCDTRTLCKYADRFGIAPGTNKVTKRPYFKGEQLIRIWRAIY